MPLQSYSEAQEEDMQTIQIGMNSLTMRVNEMSTRAEEIPDLLQIADLQGRGISDKKSSAYRTKSLSPSRKKAAI